MFVEQPLALPGLLNIIKWLKLSKGREAFLKVLCLGWHFLGVHLHLHLHLHLYLHLHLHLCLHLYHLHLNQATTKSVRVT